MKRLVSILILMAVGLTVGLTADASNNGKPLTQ